MTASSPSARTLLVATTNAGKLREIRGILDGLPIPLLTLRDRPGIPEPDETGHTFAENARLKAVYYAGASGLLSVADDSGLEIEALDNAPGVHSARWQGSDYAIKFRKIQELLHERGVSRQPRPLRVPRRPGARRRDSVRERRNRPWRNDRRTAGHERLRIRPHLLLSSARTDAGRVELDRKGWRQPPRPGIRGAQGLPARASDLTALPTLRGPHPSNGA